MARTGGDLLVDVLIDWGVKFVFGMPGDGINGIMESLRQRQDEIRFIQVRHEESAAFMACGYAKYTGKLGVCLATSGPGGIHLLNGLYDAKLDGQPVLAITGHHFHDLIETHSQQDIDLDRLFMDVTCYNARVMGVEHVENVTHLACRAAIGRNGVAHINFPVDTQSQTVEERSQRNVPERGSPVIGRRSGTPAQDDLLQAAEILNAGKKVAILAGRGALDATSELEVIADLLGAPVIKPLLGKACLPDDSPFTTGGIGLLGTLPSHEAVQNCDTLFLIGTAFPYIEFLPKPGAVRGVQIDVDPLRIALRFPVEVGLVGDSVQTLRSLLPHLRRKEDRTFLQTAQQGMVEWRKLMDERSSRSDVPMKPQVIAHAVGKLLPERAAVACDSGTITTWWARHIPANRGQLHSVSGMLSSMACSVPYAIAAQLAHPDRFVVAIAGDGGFSMLMAEFATAVKYDLPIKVIVFSNGTLGQIKWEQLVFLGNPEYGCELHPIDFAAFARACGAEGYTITDPADCDEVLFKAFETPGPVIIDAIIDPFEPPMPPHATLEHTWNLAKSLARGTPDAGAILSTIAKDKIKEVF